MTIASNKNTPRNTYTATASQTTFTIGFEFFKVEDVKVYKNGSLLTYNASPSGSTQYKITGTASSSDDAYEFGAGGSVILGSGASADDIIVIIRDITLERTSDFPSVGSFDITTLNTQLDTMVSMISDLKQQTDRSVKLLDTDTISATVTLPAKATRASKILGFDSNGNAETTVNSAGLATLSGISSDITTVAGISSDVTSVANIASNVTAVANDATDIGAVAAKATEIGRLGTADAVADMALLGTADVVADMALLGSADVIADMALLANADVIADMNTLATTDIVSDLNTLATTDIVSDLNTLATSDIVSDLNTLATSDIVSDINTLATSDIVSDLNLLATSDFVSDLNTLATSANVTAITNVSDDIANVNTVATNISSINNFEQRYRVASSDPTSSLDAGDLVFNTTANQLKYYDGSSFNTIVSTDTNVKVSGNDTTSDVLLNKIAGGTLINVVETNNGSNETLTINSTAASTGKAIAMAIVFG